MQNTTRHHQRHTQRPHTMKAIRSTAVRAQFNYAIEYIKESARLGYPFVIFEGALFPELIQYFTDEGYQIDTINSPSSSSSLANHYPVIRISWLDPPTQPVNPTKKTNIIEQAEAVQTPPDPAPECCVYCMDCKKKIMTDNCFPFTNKLCLRCFDARLHTYKLPAPIQPIAHEWQELYCVDCKKRICPEDHAPVASSGMFSMCLGCFDARYKNYEPSASTPEDHVFRPSIVVSSKSATPAKTTQDDDKQPQPQQQHQPNGDPSLVGKPLFC